MKTLIVTLSYPGSDKGSHERQRSSLASLHVWYFWNWLPKLLCKVWSRLRECRFHSLWERASLDGKWKQYWPNSWGKVTWTSLVFTGVIYWLGWHVHDRLTKKTFLSACGWNISRSNTSCSRKKCNYTTNTRTWNFVFDTLVERTLHQILYCVMVLTIQM